MIDCAYKNSRYGEHGVTRHGYAVDAPFVDEPRETRSHYSKWFGTAITGVRGDIKHRPLEYRTASFVILI